MNTKSKLAIALITIIGIFCIVVALQPSAYSISRSINIKASPATVFMHINKLANWHAWSPWVELDPNAKVSFAGPEEGTDASMTWNGNDQMGEGTLTIVESKMNELVGYRLDFARPKMASAMAKFELKPDADGTLVIWTMYGEDHNFVGKAMWMVFCSKMIGKQFEKGLNNMKTVIEV